MALHTITCNGNDIEPTLQGPDYPLGEDDAKDAANTKYIIIQSDGRLSIEQKEDLQTSGVVVQSCISENTYLCEYDPADLSVLRSKNYVNYVNVFLSKLKVNPRLKSERTTAAIGSAAPEESKVDVDILFHEGVDGTSLQSRIAEAAHSDPSDVEISRRKARLTTEKRYLDALSSIDEIFSIEDVRAPQLYNNIARTIIKADDIQLNGTSYRGNGQVVAVADTGFDKGNRTGDVHPAFEGRVQQIYVRARGKKDAADPDGGEGHGTHVCGSVLGDATSQSLGVRIQGTAPEAKLVMQACSDNQGNLSGIPFDLDILFSEPYIKDNTRIHTNSWGKPLPANQRQGEYDASSSDIDTFIHNNKDMTILFAAGNDGMDLNRDGVIDARQIGSEAAAKNCITVGASENNRPEIDQVYGSFGAGFAANPLNKDRIANDPEGMAAFSSRGPTAENRIKPDVTAPGTSILSARARSLSAGVNETTKDPLWTFLSGTSMATPLVAGCVTVLRETLVKNGTNNPSAALIKALVINGAVDMRGQYQKRDVGASPNSVDGWGRVDLAGSVIVPGAGNTTSGFGEGEALAAGDEKSFSIDIPATGGVVNGGTQAPLAAVGKTLKITLVWTDPPGALLQNDLDLMVVASDGKERHGNMGENSNDFDRTNNVEQVVWKNVPGGEVKVTVRCASTAKLGERQDYAFAWKIL